MKNLIVPNIVLQLLLLVSSKAHDTFLRVEDHYLEADASTNIHMFNGTYFHSINSFDNSYLDKFLQSSNDEIRELDLSLLVRNESKSKFWIIGQKMDGFFGGINEHHTRSFEFKAEKEGSYLFAFKSKYSRIAMTQEKYAAEYLVEEVHVDPMDYPFDTENPDEKIIDRYVKLAKTIIQVGDIETDNVTKPIGFITEIVPLTNPASLREGDELKLLLLHESKPMSEQIVLFGRENDEDMIDSVISDENGIITLKLDESGDWWLNYIYVKKNLVDADLDFESHMTSLTFSIK